MTKAKLLKSVLTLALSAHASFAQRAAFTSSQSSAQTVERPSPPQSPSPEKWERYTFEGDEFSVELPEMPFVSESLRSVGPTETERVRDFGLYSGGIVYMITSYDRPRAAESLDYFAGYGWTYPKFKAAGDLRLGGFEGREYESARGYRLRARVFRTKRHAYRVRAMNYGEEDPRLVRFLDSFALGGKPAGRQIHEPTTPAYGATAGGETYRPSEVTRKAVIVFKPEPDYTEDARRNSTQGVVRLRAVLAADGKVKDISVVKGLPDGLTKKAVSAARHILFFPAFKDGGAVSQHVTLEYDFNIY